MRAGIAATIGAAILWGSSFPVTKLGLPFFGDALFFAAIRLSIATIFAFILLRFLGRLNWRIFRSPLIWLLGLTNALGITLQNYGLEITTASKTALLVDINVVIVAILSFWLFKERFKARKVGGVLAGVVGIILLTYSPNLALHQEQLLGDIIVFLSGCSYALFIVFMKKGVEIYKPFELTVSAIALSALMLLIVSAVMIPTGHMNTRIEIDALAPLLFLAIICTTIAYYLWAFGLKHMSATVSSTILLFEVVSALLLSYLLLGERMTYLMMIGAFFIILAIVIVSKSGNEKRTGDYASS